MRRFFGSVDPITRAGILATTALALLYVGLGLLTSMRESAALGAVTQAPVEDCQQEPKGCDFTQLEVVISTGNSFRTAVHDSWIPAVSSAKHAFDLVLGVTVLVVFGRKVFEFGLDALGRRRAPADPES